MNGAARMRDGVRGEEVVMERLTAMGCQVKPWGLHDDLREVVGDFATCGLRWTPDLITYSDNPPFYYGIDVKTPSKSYPNMSVEMSCLKAADGFALLGVETIYIDASNFRCCWWTDIDRSNPSTYNNGGSGTPYVLHPHLAMTPIDEFFPLDAHVLRAYYQATTNKEQS
jgi:hypothetical protein